jgi:hypothetical protein
MSALEINELNRSALINIENIRIDTSLPANQRTECFLEQIKNPYCFLALDTVIQVRFEQSGHSLRDRLKSYFTSIKT